MEARMFSIEPIFLGIQSSYISYDYVTFFFIWVDMSLSDIFIIVIILVTILSFIVSYHYCPPYCVTFHTITSIIVVILTII